MNFEDFVSQNELKFAFDLFLALVFGILIGGERELRKKDAGISTHTMVIVGAMMFTFLSSAVDPASKSRIAAQVVSGIGFLGAGLILKGDGGRVSNLTTASSIWFSGGIGMALGFDYHIIATLGAIACMLIPRIPKVRSSGKQEE